MGFEVDEDILQDFLIEASEILEQLSEQLVDLEKRPEDSDLLNAIFRGFHTVKGGAGFLSLAALVDVCHGAENVFDLLRTGQRRVDAELMDVILQALDTVNLMFGRLQRGEHLAPASPALLEALHQLCDPSSTPSSVPEVTPPVPVVSQPAGKPAASGCIDDMTQDEFDRLLDELHGDSQTGTVAKLTIETEADPGGDDISDDEFEALLDQLHGRGKHSGTPVNQLAEPKADASEHIDDDEFEKLLDSLHGQGKGPTAQASTPAQQTKMSPTAAATPAPAPSSSSQTPQSQPETTVRVDTKTLDVIMNMVGELVLVRNRLVSLGVASEDEELSKAVANLDVVTADLQGAVMKTRMQPIKKVFGRFPRVVRDLARSLNKEINLVMEGEETDLDKNLVEALADPLVHLVRNSCDHGIELPEIRRQCGKPALGTITLSASQEGDHILLCIQDDGAGMDPEKLKSIAISRGILDTDAAARMSDNEAYNLIFAPGFSTKAEISDISGRGVGMDVVKTSISQLNGTIHIHSAKGEGTRLEIKVPLTLAILPTLMVEVGQQTFALPLTNVNEIFHLDLTRARMVDGQQTIVVRDKAIPLFYLQEWLVRGGRNAAPMEQGHVVIVQIGPQLVGFVVDNLIGQEEVVIKPLDKLLHGTPGMAGATITSDGGIALILDIPSLLKAYARRR